MIRMAPITLLACVVSFAADARADGPSPVTTRPTNDAAVRVMSFNVRNSAAKDGEDAWDERKAFLADTIRAYGPDLLGTQEVLPDQADFLQQQFPEYGFVGGGRDDGKRKGEFSPVMYRKSRFDLLAHGQFWLSETPEKVGSKGWDAALPRIVTWVRLKDRTAGGASLLLFNTHWDHVGKVARVESGKLMRRQLDAMRDGLPVVVVGDFNSTEDSPQYKTLVAGDGAGARLVDAYRVTHPQAAPDEATYHAFKGTRDGRRIDWVLCSPEWAVKGAAIDRTQKDGRYPSDHYAVTAELALKR